MKVGNFVTSVRKEVITIEFECRHSMRIAQLSLSEMDMDEIFCVSLLAPGWRDSTEVTKFPNIILTDKMAKHFKEFIISDDIINLRWFDGGGRYGTNPKGLEVSEDGFMCMEVEITYTSKQLDRQEKLDVLGVK